MLTLKLENPDGEWRTLGKRWEDTRRTGCGISQYRGSSGTRRPRRPLINGERDVAVLAFHDRQHHSLSL